MGGHVAGRRLRLSLPPARPRGGLSLCRRGGHRRRGRRARSVVATRESSDPNRDLWWAHTGGGGGNFGVVTRYWFRSPGAAGERSRDAPAARAGVDHDVQGRMELERHRPAVLPAAAPQSRDLVRTQQRRRFPQRIALDACSRSIARQFGKLIVRGVSTAGPPPSGRWTIIWRRSARGSSRRAAASSTGCPGSSSRSTRSPISSPCRRAA